MNNFVLLNIDWTCYNGFTFQLLHLELYKPVNIDHSLFGIYFAFGNGGYFYVDLFFRSISIVKHPLDKIKRDTHFTQTVK